MNKNQTWQCSSIVDVGYKVGDDGRKHLANQFHTCVIRLDASLGATVDERIVKKCREIIEQRLFTRLSNADSNYGVEGLKRWDVSVVSLRCVSASSEAEEVE